MRGEIQPARGDFMRGDFIGFFVLNPILSDLAVLCKLGL